MPELAELMKQAACVMQVSDLVAAFAARHGVHAAPVLTVCDDALAAGLAYALAPRIRGKTVIEIGGGIGLLACHLADYAERVWCVEANPVWSSAFVTLLLKTKPKNLSYLFGAADEFAGVLKTDIALFCSHSGLDSMKEAGRLFAPSVIDVYGELIERNPEKFDGLAVKLRAVV